MFRRWWVALMVEIIDWCMGWVAADKGLVVALVSVRRSGGPIRERSSGTQFELMQMFSAAAASHLLAHRLAHGSGPFGAHTERQKPLLN